MKEKIVNTFRIIILSAILSTAIGYSLADFVAPSCPPPCGNTPPPINVGNAPQMRAGNLFITSKLFTASTVAGDPGNTAATKDYVDSKVTGVGDMKYVTGNSCAACPYGFAVISNTALNIEVSCNVKDFNGIVKEGREAETCGWYTEVGTGVGPAWWQPSPWGSGWTSGTFASGLGSGKTWGFWTY